MNKLKDRISKAIILIFAILVASCAEDPFKDYDPGTEPLPEDNASIEGFWVDNSTGISFEFKSRSCYIRQYDAASNSFESLILEGDYSASYYDYSYDDHGSVTITSVGREYNYTIKNITSSKLVLVSDSDNKEYNLTSLSISANSTIKFVDLGLPSGTLWADCNLGAFFPEEIGNIYSFGTTIDGDDNYLRKSSYGDDYIDGTKYDAAYVANNLWSMPLETDVNELIYYCTVTEDKRSSIPVIVVTGENGNEIVLPKNSSYWLGQFYTYGNYDGYTMMYSQKRLSLGTARCSELLPIRPVKRPK